MSLASSAICHHSSTKVYNAQEPITKPSANRPAHITQSHTYPDIIFIPVDDMGYSDISCYGSEIGTPNLEPTGAVRFGEWKLVNKRPGG